MTILTHEARKRRHRVDPRAGHDRTDRLRAAVRTTHAPLDRTQVALVAYAAGLLTAVLVAAAMYWIGAA